MEVKAGYKQTEIGIIPEDWQVKPLTGLVDIQHGFGFQSQYFTSFGNFRLTTPGHFYEEGGFRDLGDKQKYYDGPLPSGYLLNEGDMIVAMTEQADGLLGSAALVPIGGTYLHNQRLGKIKILSPELSIKYLYLVFNSRAYRAKVKETAAGTKVKHTSPTKLLEIPIPIPATITEQEAIAEALSDADALIEALEQLIAKKRQVKQGAMQELFTGNRRLLGFSKEWKEKRLGELSEMGSGGTPLTSNPNFYDGDIPWVSITDMTKGGKIISSTERNLTTTGLNNSAAQMFPAGTVLYAMYASLGECSIAEVPLCTSQAILGIRTKPSLHNEFLYYYLLYIKPQVKTMGQHGTQANLNKGMVQDFQLKLPSIPEQTAIAEILSDMDAEITALEGKLSKVREVKQGMTSMLLTGRVRVV